MQMLNLEFKGSVESKTEKRFFFQVPEKTFIHVKTIRNSRMVNHLFLKSLLVRNIEAIMDPIDLKFIHPLGDDLAVVLPTAQPEDFITMVIENRGTEMEMFEIRLKGGYARG